MASAVVAFRPTVALLVVFLLIPSMTMPSAEGACPLVSKRSKTWSGFCGSSDHCNNQCKTWETAKHGACHNTYKSVFVKTEVLCWLKLKCFRWLQNDRCVQQIKSILLNDSVTGHTTCSS